MNPQSDWQQLLRVALLGTRQSGEPAPALPELPTPPDAPREAQVLGAAGALGLVRKAGFAPPLGRPGEPPAPAETRPTLGLQGQDALRQLLDDQYEALLPEYLQALAQHGRRVPHRQLVALLDYVAPKPELHPAAAAVLGERGRWLARLNSAWTPLLAAALDETTWETGKPAQRRDYLRALRGQDPARARALLAEALPQEPAKQQAALLGTLEVNLGSADAPLLEPALASKSKDVRQEAAYLLVRVPGNALVERLWLRARPYLALHNPLLGRTKLEVTLPEAWDAGWQADGIEAKDARFTGEKAAWLGQLLCLIPPARWSAAFNASPAKLLALAADGEWAELLLTAWRQALLLHPSPDWARAYLALQLERDGVPTLWPDELAELLGLPELTQTLLQHLPAPARLSQPEAGWEPLLLRLPGPWPPALTERALGIIEHTLAVPAGTSRYQLHYRLGHLLKHLQQVVPPEQYARCAERLGPLLETEPALHNAVNELLDTLQFRQRLSATFTEPPGPDS
jgi:hypothetical protein